MGIENCLTSSGVKRLPRISWEIQMRDILVMEVRAVFLGWIIKIFATCDSVDKILIISIFRARSVLTHKLAKHQYEPQMKRFKATTCMTANIFYYDAYVCAIEELDKALLLSAASSSCASAVRVRFVLLKLQRALPVYDIYLCLSLNQKEGKGRPILNCLDPVEVVVSRKSK